MLAERIATRLGLSVAYIARVARSASHMYRTYEVPKRSGPGMRTIHHPSKELKALHRWLVQSVVARFAVHDAAHAYRDDVSIRDHAVVHASSRFLLRLDLESFFPSIKTADIRLLLQQHCPDFSPDDCNLFCSLVCRNGSLTIGAPTSPALSNAICWDLDEALSTAAKRRSVRYTRYADDLYFSSTSPNQLEQLEAVTASTLANLKYPANLRINATKTWHMSMKGHRRVTGIVLGSDGSLSLGRAYKRRIRGLIHRHDRLSETERRSLSGHLAYIMGMEPEFYNRLVLKYGSEAIAVVTQADQTSMEPSLG